MSSLQKRHSASSSKLVSRLKALDAYPKINEDFFTRTLSGGIITIVSSVIMLLLFISELRKCGMSAQAHASAAVLRPYQPPARWRRSVLGYQHGARAVSGHIERRDDQHKRGLDNCSLQLATQQGAADLAGSSEPRLILLMR
jgi:hypothetical protein